MENNKINRRDFLMKSGKAVAVGAIALSTFDIVKLLAKSKDISFEPNGQDKVINISDYPDLASVGGYAMISKSVIVIRNSSSKFTALSTICTHKKCDVEFDGSGFECPCHGSTYDKSGKVTNGPATKNLKKYKTTFNSSEDSLTINM